MTPTTPGRFLLLTGSLCLAGWVVVLAALWSLVQVGLWLWDTVAGWL